MVLDSVQDNHILNLFTCPVIWFKSFLFCRLNLTDIDREQTIYRSCEQLEFPAENFQVLRVNILSIFNI